jgi:hypothetical protein
VRSFSRRDDKAERHEGPKHFLLAIQGQHSELYKLEPGTVKWKQALRQACNKKKGHG